MERMTTVKVTPELLDDLTRVLSDADRWNSVQIFQKTYKIHVSQMKAERIARVQQFIDELTAKMVVTA
jgi:hypothetical protein